ncbi:MraY family glycosyltransferase [Petrimonas sp.]|uniref:MraY family glycosyltransferase n=1 Tax=Petrimonas sp. TaxID=2023866 RepID=UPI002FC945BB
MGVTTTYLIVLVLLLAAEFYYFRIADRFNIIDKPNERSSHNYITIRGGGIIWWVAALLFLLFHFSTTSLWFFAGITLIAGVSFWDDVSGLGQKVRLLFHLLAMSCAFYLVGVFGTYSWWAIVIGYIVFIGIVNAYNFMDGINGITGLYSIAILASLQYVNLTYGEFVNADLIWYPMIASVMFLFFNFRKRAKCFAGDVGSVSIAFWIVTLLLILIIKTENLIWLGFLLVYGVDTIMTILHRIYLKQNIMEAHRLHFYQILANEKKMPHRLVSLIYFMVQLICSVLLIELYPVINWSIFVILLVALCVVYLLKFKLMKQVIIIDNLK